MALGTQKTQQRFDNPRDLLGDRLKEGSLYRLLADHGDEMFPDDYFSDLYSDSAKGRPTIPARVMATVMLLQAFEGLSDREAVDRLSFDLRWRRPVLSENSIFVSRSAFVLVNQPTETVVSTDQT